MRAGREERGQPADAPDGRRRHGDDVINSAPTITAEDISFAVFYFRSPDNLPTFVSGRFGDHETPLTYSNPYRSVEPETACFWFNSVKHMK
jgi:hypothetical protein